MADHREATFPIYLFAETSKKNIRKKIYENFSFAHPWKNVQDSLQNASRSVVILARCIGLFPILGISESSAKGLYFRWSSKPMFFSLSVVGYSLLMDSFTTLRTIQTGLTYYSTVEFVFVASLTCVYVLFTQLAAKWPKFADEWEKAEIQTTSVLGYSRNLSKKFKILTFTIMILALIEHISSIATKVVDALPCVTNDGDLVKAYFINSYKTVFAFVNYNLIVACGVAFMTLIMSCAWNFVDVFIIIMSVAMTERYKQYNRLLKTVNNKPMPIAFWRNMRETYNQLSYLTKRLDELLSPIVLLSFANNLYFICLQLLNSLKPMQSSWHATYFVYSFSYLVLRTIAVSLFAAAIYDESKLPKAVLFSVPSESYCTEIARLLTQVSSDDLALTGCRFFSITRTLVLTIAGTIVTYEIVLVQFNTVSGDSKKNTTIACIY